MLRIIIRLSLFLILLPSIATIAAGQESIVAITHVNVIDATGAPVQSDITVIVEGKHISQIGKSGAIPVPMRAEFVDGREKYLIPGLWDMHVHEIFGAWLPEDEEIIPALFVANGVTGVRDMGGDLEPLKKWRARIAEGKLLGPRMIISGPMLDGPVPQFPSSAPVKDAVEGRRINQRLTNGILRSASTALRRMISASVAWRVVLTPTERGAQP